MLKPEDIEQKTFSTALRGYDLNEVDDFLDEVIATIRDLEEQVGSSRPDKVSAPKHDPVLDESAVGRALIAAQSAADRILEEAREEAERIRSEAKSEADTWVNERDALKAEAEREMADLTARVSSVRRELAVLATAVADSLDQMDGSIETASGTTLDSGIARSGDIAESGDATGWGHEDSATVDPVELADEKAEEEELSELWDSADSLDSPDSPDDIEDLAEEQGEGDQPAADLFRGDGD